MGEDGVTRHGFIADPEELAKDPHAALGHIADLARRLHLAHLGQEATFGERFDGEHDNDSGVIEHLIVAIEQIAYTASNRPELANLRHQVAVEAGASHLRVVRNGEEGA
jgi:hypothetical protein